MNSILISLTNKINASKTNVTFNDIMQTLDHNGFIAEKTNGQSWFWLQSTESMGDYKKKMVQKQEFVNSVYARLHEGHSFDSAIIWAIKYYLQ